MSEVDDLREENAALRRQVAEAQSTIKAFITGEVDALATDATSATPVLVMAAQDALRRSEARFALMFRRSPVALAIKTIAEGRYLDANDRFLHLFGLERDDVVGRIAQDLQIWVDSATREVFEHQLRCEGSITDFEAAVRTKNGESLSVLVSTEVIDVDGRDCYLATFADVTHRKRAEEMKERFERFFTMSRDMCCISGIDGYFRRLNPQFESLGYTLEELYAKPFIEFLHPDDVAATLAEVERLSKGELTLQFENRYRCKNGSYRSLLWSTTPDASGTLYSIARDITDLKREENANRRLAQKLLRSNKELEEFAMVASHDLQEPLRKIRMFGDRLKAKCEGTLGAEGNDYLTRMQSAAERGQSLIGGLLAYARVSTKGQPPVEVDLASVARQVVSDLEAQIASVKGRVDIGPLPIIEADALQMRQLVQNLVTNALKFHRAGESPVVRVESMRTAPSPSVAPVLDGREWWQITVADNGIGFDAQFTDRLFRLFQRLNGRSEYEGSGIGLAICKKIVERHGGSIRAESHPSGGATFFATLPDKVEGWDNTNANTETD